eukprot:TRINITY_DN12526_c0_g1_i6.p1 TRINITY_DN12526_c0_g1~~TRINITY_DN12526_c0_g1_i6.p1  ORF type:complete len:219 (-),score=53.45 TRINITY_DN12526_c0_g1_i6:554-1210(-)
MIGDCLCGGILDGKEEGGEWKGEKDDVGKLFQLALKRGYSKEGELFGGGDVVALINEYYEGKLEAEMVYGWDGEDVRRWIGQGSVCMVCYDADKDHSPIVKEGAKAHWAVLMGVCGKRKRKEGEGEQVRIQVDTLKEVQEGEEGMVEWVIARHGKTKRIGIWQLDALIESNGGLGNGAWESKGGTGRWNIPEDMEDLRGGIVKVQFIQMIDRSTIMDE